jgi:hypothetical protein
VLFSADFSNLFDRHTFTGLQTNVSQTGAFGRFASATDPGITHSRQNRVLVIAQPCPSQNGFVTYQPLKAPGGGPSESLLTGCRDARQQDARETELEGFTRADSLKNFG